MRIAMISAQAGPLSGPQDEDCGGAHVHVAELSAALVTAGHEVSVYIRRDRPAEPTPTERAGARIVSVQAGPACVLPADRLLAQLGLFARGLVDDWATDPPDVVHAHCWMSGLAAQLAVRGQPAGRPPIPVVQTFRDLQSVRGRFGDHPSDTGIDASERLRLERMIACSADRVAATSAAEVAELVRMGVARTSIIVAPSGVDVERFTPTGPVASRGGRFRLLCVGSALSHKGIDTVIAALRLLPEAELVVVGGGTCDGTERDAARESLRAHAQRSGVSDRVHWAGPTPRSRLPAVLRSADVVVCAPWYESFGIVGLEAMACGVPVVVTPVGGLADTVVDGVTGLHVPPSEVTTLASTLRSLIRDASRRQSLGVAGCDRAKARYSWNRIAADTARIYSTVHAPQRSCVDAELADQGAVVS